MAMVMRSRLGASIVQPSTAGSVALSSVGRDRFDRLAVAAAAATNRRGHPLHGLRHVGHALRGISGALLLAPACTASAAFLMSSAAFSACFCGFGFSARHWHVATQELRPI